jgi:hypothetical protein
MPTLIMRARTLAVDSTDLARFAVVRLDPATCRRLCRLIEFAGHIADTLAPTAFYGLDVAETVTIAWCDHIETVHAEQRTPIDWRDVRDVEIIDQPVFVGEDDDADVDDLAESHEFYAVDHPIDLTTDADDLPGIVGSRLTVTDEEVWWSCFHKHSGEIAETPWIPYGQLAVWAGWWSVPMPWRLLTRDELDTIVRTHPIERRDRP